MLIIKVLAGTFVAAYISINIQRALEAPYWACFAISAGLALLFYVLGSLLMNFYLTRDFGVVDTSDVAPGVQAWETTAGSGVVPRWVSYLSLLSGCFALALPFELLASLVL